MPVFDVAVVGLGPVGATVASLLAMEGLSVAAVDRSAAIYDRPRAIGLDHESLRAFQRIGLGEALPAVLGRYRPSEYRAADGGLLRRLLPVPEPDPAAWPAYATFIQPALDRALRDRLGAWPAVRQFLGQAVTGLDQGADAARLTLADGSAIEARWVLAADGAGSTIRRLLGTRLEDLGFDEPWVVVDTLLERDVPLPPTNVQYCDPRRPTTFVIGPDPLRRWEFMLLPGEDPVAMAEPDQVWRLLSPWIRPGDARLWRAAAYRFHALVAEEWRDRRVLLLGDAAHQTPPFMAQGLNQGIRDAVNLAWKLARVVRGENPAALLDSYQRERRPNVRQVIALTKELGRIVCERDPAAVAARDAALRAEVAAGRGDVVRGEMLPPLEGGALSATPGAGRPVPQPWLAGRRRMDDVIGGGFRLFHRGGALPATPALARAVPLETLGEADGLLAGWLDRHGAAAVLVRPDDVAFGTATTLAGVPALVEAARAALGAGCVEAESLNPATRRS